jgi:hypothetical protein
MPLSVVAVAGSAGASTAMREILAGLPADFPAAILYLQHQGTEHAGVLAEVLQWSTVLPVRRARPGDAMEAGVVHVCPPGFTLLVQPGGVLALAPTPTRREALQGADRFLVSVAASCGARAVAVVLSGAGRDGSEGVCAVRARHGTVLIQDEGSAVVWGMPKAALATGGGVDLMLPPRELAPVLVNLVRDGHALAALRARAAARSAHARPSVVPALHACLDRLLARAVAMHRTDLGNLQLLDRETGALTIAAQRGFGLDFLEHFQTVDVQDGSACGRALRLRAPVLVADVARDPDFARHRDIAGAAGFCAVQSTPLIGRDGVLLGVLSTHFRRPGWLSPPELRKLEEHARRASGLIGSLQAVAGCRRPSP